MTVAESAVQGRSTASRGSRGAERIPTLALEVVPRVQTGPAMSDVTHILNAINLGNARAAEQLLPLIYDELRRLAAAKMANEAPTIRSMPRPLCMKRSAVGRGSAFRESGHFFRVAAEAMRRILIDRARRKRRAKHGGDRERQSLSDVEIAAAAPVEQLLALHEALDRFAKVAPVKAELVKLRYFAGLCEEEAAAASVSPALPPAGTGPTPVPG